MSVEIAAMTPADAATLEALIAAEPPGYMAHLQPFAHPGDLRRQQGAARRDRFATLRRLGQVVGFYCLRGLDAGWAKPTFGVYVMSAARGQGLAAVALAAALEWARAAGIQTVMLKVAPDHHAARKVYEAAGFLPVGSCPDSGYTVMEFAIAKSKT